MAWHTDAEVRPSNTVHLWSDTEEHDLGGMTCWCRPKCVLHTATLVMHRDELERTGPRL